MQHGSRAAELLTQLQSEFTPSGVVPLLDDVNDIYWLDASSLNELSTEARKLTFFYAVQSASPFSHSTPLF